VWEEEVPDPAGSRSAQRLKSGGSRSASGAVKSLAQRFPKAAQMLRDAEEEIPAYMAFPTEHWRQLHSTNPLERLMREIGRRTDVVGIFPNRASLIRLAAVLMEQQDEWMAAPRRYFSLASMSKLYPNQERLETKELLAVAKP